MSPKSECKVDMSAATTSEEKGESNQQQEDDFKHLLDEEDAVFMDLDF